MDKYKIKYRIASARLQNWNYCRAGAYFITICTQNRLHYFGEIVDRKMQLSHIGIIADVMWHEMINHSQHIELGQFVVMPNHIHGVLIITYNDNENGNENVNENDNDNLETGHALSLQPKNQSESRPKPIGKQRFQNIGKNSVSSIIGGYKSAVTKHARRLGFEFQWQSRFYDHIIRDDASFQNITDYVMNNPLNWEEDKFFNT
jgi:REP element-mobilizing transposase RayT